MNMLNFSAALMSVGLLMAVPAFAETAQAPTLKQPTQEGGGSTWPEQCGLPFNANPAADPNCKQRTQSLVPSPAQASSQAAVQPK